MNYEIIGITGTVLILIAFLCNSEEKIRILDMLGAIAFVVYGFLIKAPSNVILNGILIIIQIVKLVKLHKRAGKGG